MLETANDESIVAHMRRAHALLLSKGSAERIERKLVAACLPQDGDGETVNIKGRDLPMIDRLAGHLNRSGKLLMWST